MTILSSVNAYSPIHVLAKENSPVTSSQLSSAVVTDSVTLHATSNNESALAEDTFSNVVYTAKGVMNVYYTLMQHAEGHTVLDQLNVPLPVIIENAENKQLISEEKKS